eukprot:3355666-Prymnesium_polylepis.1
MIGTVCSLFSGVCGPRCGRDTGHASQAHGRGLPAFFLPNGDTPPGSGAWWVRYSAIRPPGSGHWCPVYSATPRRRARERRKQHAAAVPVG